MIADILLTIAGAFFTIAVIPQIIKNFIHRDCNTHSLSWHGITFIAIIMTLVAYSMVNLWLAFTMNVIQLVFRIILITQIIYWSDYPNGVVSYYLEKIGFF